MVLASSQHWIVYPPTCSNVRIWTKRPEQMEANQASLCAAEGLHGLQIRGFARQAASIASTRQSNQKRNPRSCNKGDRSENELISLAMPPLLHWQRRQWRQQWAEAKNSNIWGYLILYRHANENGENTDIQNPECHHNVLKQTLQEYRINALGRPKTSP